MRKTHRASCSRWFPEIGRAACIKPVNFDGSLLQVVELQGLNFRMGTSFGVLERALGLIMGFPWSCQSGNQDLNGHARRAQELERIEQQSAACPGAWTSDASLRAHAQNDLGGSSGSDRVKPRRSI